MPLKPLTPEEAEMMPDLPWLIGTKYITKMPLYVDFGEGRAFSGADYPQYHGNHDPIAWIRFGYMDNLWLYGAEAEQLRRLIQGNID